MVRMWSLTDDTRAANQYSMSMLPKFGIICVLQYKKEKLLWNCNGTYGHHVQDYEIS